MPISWGLVFGVSDMGRRLMFCIYILHYCKNSILASIIQILGLGIFILSDNFSLVTLAICSSMSEVVLWISRYLIYFKNRSLFVRSK